MGSKFTIFFIMALVGSSFELKGSQSAGLKTYVILTQGVYRGNYLKGTLCPFLKATTNAPGKPFFRSSFCNFVASFSVSNSPVVYL